MLSRRHLGACFTNPHGGTYYLRFKLTCITLGFRNTNHYLRFTLTPSCTKRLRTLRHHLRFKLTCIT